MQTSMSYLTLCCFVLLDTESCFCHCFLDHTNWVWMLSRRIHTFFCNESSDFLSKRCEIVVAFLLSNLNLSFVENLIIAINLEIIDTNIKLRYLFHNIWYLGSAKSFFQIATFCYFAFGYVYKDVTNLQYIV